MSKYIEIQLQSPTDAAAYLAQWYVDGQPSGRAFPISTVSELHFVAFFAEAPRARFDPPLFPRWLFCAIRTDNHAAAQQERSYVLHRRDYVTGDRELPRGFEDSSEAWDAVSRLRCEAQRRRRKVRYEVR